MGSGRSATDNLGIIHMVIKTTKEKINLKGKITVTSYKRGTLDKALPFLERINELVRQGKGKDDVIYGLRKKVKEILINGKIKAISNHNLIMVAANYGTDLIIQRLNGFLVPATYDLAINYLAIGTGQTTPANSDTQLTAETARAVVIYSQDVAFNELQLQAFFPDINLANGTYYEAGSFLGAWATPNSGQIFNHALFATPCPCECARCGRERTG